MKGKINAYIKGYVFFDVYGEIEVTQYVKVNKNTIEIVRFKSLDANFDFEDRTIAQEIITRAFVGTVINVKLIKEKSGFISICVLQVHE
jgi:hypothetical protein